jgi:HEXXH motif-containing protein
MIPPAHELPRWVFSALAAGGGGPDAIRLLRAAQYSKNLMLIRAIVHAAEDGGHPERAVARRAYDALRLLHRTIPSALGAMLTYPPVGAWAVETTSLLARGGNRASARPGQLAAVAAAAAVLGGAALDIEVPAIDGALVLPAVGALGLPGGANRASVRCTPDRAEVAVAGGPVIGLPAEARDGSWHGVPRIVVRCADLTLSVRLDGASWVMAPRTVSAGGHVVDTGAVSVGPWRRWLAGAWRLLVRYHRPVAEEIAEAIVVLAPLVPPAVGLHSGTFQQAFGAVVMSLPPERRMGAVALAHEVQHGKLAGLMDLVELFEPGGPELYYAPWRPDPRPLVGLLHGAYAHLGVAAFWRRQRRGGADPDDGRRAEVEFTRWRDATHDVVRLLGDNERLTDPGRRLVAGMAAVLDGWRCEAASPEAMDAARRIRERHYQAWTSAHANRAGTDRNNPNRSNADRSGR